MLSKSSKTKEYRLDTLTLLGILTSLSLIALILFLLYKIFFFQKPKEIFTSYSPYVLHLFKFTLFQATLSTIFSIFFGLVLSWSLSHWRNFPFRGTLISLFSSTLVLPSIVVVLGIITVFGKHGWINQILEKLFDKSLGGYIYGLGGILFAHIYFNASYAGRVFLDIFESIPLKRYKLAKNLGLNIWQRFYYIEFPNIKPYIFGLSLSIFLLCFSSFVIVLILGGSPTYNTLEVAIYEALKYDFDLPLAIKLSFLQIIISTILLFFISKNQSIVKTSTLSYKGVKWIESKKELLYHKVVILLFILIFTTPLLAIITNGFSANFSKLFSQSIFQRAFFISICIAFTSTLFSLIISLILSFAKAKLQLLKKSSLYIFFSKKLIDTSSMLYLMVPSIVLGVGFFLLSQSLNFSIHFIAFLALIFANTILSLAFTFNTLYPKIFLIKSRYDKTINSIGIKPLSKIFYIYLPNLKREIIYSLALSFSFSLGDLSVIALFGDKQIITLPWLLYQKMGSYQNSDAAGIALILMVVVLFSFITTLRASSVKDR